MCFWRTPGTLRSSSSVAARIAATLPSVVKSERFSAGPMPGRSSSADLKRRALPRRSRARFEKRCASSRARARKKSDAEWLFSGIGFFWPGR